MFDLLWMSCNPRQWDESVSWSMSRPFYNDLIKMPKKLYGVNIWKEATEGEVQSN